MCEAENLSMCNRNVGEIPIIFTNDTKDACVWTEMN